MRDTRDLPSVVDAAEQAAAAGDYVAAEQLLREAVVLQERHLGPLHPDLAHTLNNLGVACEVAEKPEDAERCYRRAYAIATAVLEPDHPFVATSRKNLSDFYRVRGRSVALLDTLESFPPESAQHAKHPAQKRRPWSPSRPLTIGAVGVAGIVLLTFTATRPWLGSSRSSSNEQTAVSTVATQPSPAERPSAPETAPTTPIPVPAETTTTGRGPVRRAESRGDAASGLPSLTVAEAHLCRNLSINASRRVGNDWPCDRPSDPVKPGGLFFYTRLKAAHETTVQHRWYRDGRLLQMVELEILPNPAGYRTYSRATVDRAPSDWKVELRTQNGALLYEEHFIVR
jgi:hypothetical protein